jgi:hypothetical protein
MLSFFRRVSEYTRKDPINTKITDELNIFDLRIKILMSTSQWKYQVPRMGDTKTGNVISIARQRVGKHITATYAHATIGYPLLGNGPVNTHP